MTKTNSFRHLDLFSGIGGFALAASWVWGDRHKVVSFCEQNKYCQKILTKHWSGTPIHTDIKGFRQQNELSKHRGYDYGRIDLLTGGFPCQPYSTAGVQRGSEDDRALWPEMFRVIKATKPRRIIGENVIGFVGMGLDHCLSDLEAQGYEARAFIIPACGVQAIHKRDRVWIVAYDESGVDWQNFQKSIERQKPEFGKGLSRDIVPHAQVCGWNESPVTAAGKHQGSTVETGGRDCNGLIPNPQYGGRESGRQAIRLGRTPESMERHRNWLKISESPICEADDGIPNRVEQISGYGNSIVPQVVMVIMACMKQIDDQQLELFA